MRDKKYIIAAIVVLVLILVIFLLALLWPTGQEETVEPVNPFADTSSERLFPGSEDELTRNLTTGWITPEATSKTEAPMFRLISKEPALGPVAYNEIDQKNTPTLRYVDRRTGYIMETPLPTVEEPVAQTVQQVLRVGGVEWTQDGRSTLLRYLDNSHETIFSFVGTFGNDLFLGTTTSSTTESMGADFNGRPLTNDIISASFAPYGSQLFYLVATESGTVGYVESAITGNRREVFSSPLRSLTARWDSPSTIVIYNNPSLVARGVVWKIDTNTWESEAVLADEYAIAARMNQRGTKLLYSLHEDEADVPSLRVLDMQTGDISYMPTATLVEKCVWGHESTPYIYCAVPRNLGTKGYLDRWQKGQFSSDDVLWRFSTDSGAAERILDPSVETGMSFDIVDLVLDPQNTYLVFRARDTELLWAVKLPKDAAPAPEVNKDEEEDGAEMSEE